MAADLNMNDISCDEFVANKHEHEEVELIDGIDNQAEVGENRSEKKIQQEEIGLFILNSG